ncbi:MAG: veratrol--corrinoid protein metyltransferase [Oscillospiraceae bacterium]|nr:veratrol--corrinoid protein metyltransferase [Oscillospiraceae bacterium]
MTEKQNYLMLLNGQQPEWVPQYTFGPSLLGRPVAKQGIAPAFLTAHIRTPGITKDIWGVTNVPCAEAGASHIPEPDNFILKDIRQWRDVIKAPDISHFDWETIAKKDFETANINREETAVSYNLFVGFFQQLIAFMGFTEGLCAMYEEPEEVKALMEYMCDFYMEVGEKSIDYYKPEIYSITDDTAAWKNSFFSLEMYRELIKPYAARLATLGLDRGLPIEMHNCGRCEDFIDDWRDFGVGSWNPAQTSNDLAGIKKKYGNSLVICGGWDIVGVLAEGDVTEETVKESVRNSIDALAAGGGYAFCGSFLGAMDDELTIRRNKWIAEAVFEYGRAYYR